MSANALKVGTLIWDSYAEELGVVINPVHFYKFNIFWNKSNYVVVKGKDLLENSRYALYAL